MHAHLEIPLFLIVMLLLLREGLADVFLPPFVLSLVRAPDFRKRQARRSESAADCALCERDCVVPLAVSHLSRLTSSSTPP